MTTYKPFTILGPGDTIREELEYYGWTQEDLAEITGLSKKHISQLVTNKAPITFDTARKLSTVFKQSPQFWLNADARYRLSLEESAGQDPTAAKALIYRFMPVRQLRQLGWLSADPRKLVPEVLAFWGLEKLSFEPVERQLAVCFRKSDARDSFNHYYALTWLQRARNLAREHPASSVYDETAVNRIASKLTDYTASPRGVQNVVRDLAQAGVLLLRVPHLENTYLDGATFWDGDTPVIVYSGRYNRNDHFWFTLAHELGHLLLHPAERDRPFLDSLDDLDKDDRREFEADDFARRSLKIPDILRHFAKVQRVSRIRVEECANVLGLHPAIVVGALQFSGRLRYTALNDLKKQVHTDIAEATHCAVASSAKE